MTLKLSSASCGSAAVAFSTAAIAARASSDSCSSGSAFFACACNRKSR